METGKQSFMKIMFGDSVWDKMRFPPKFVQLFAKDIASATTATLVVPSGRSWTADISHEKDNVCLKKGWGQFLTDNLVRENEILAFGYLGNMRFFVQVFGVSGLERTNVDFPEKQKQSPIVKKKCDHAPKAKKSVNEPVLKTGNAEQKYKSSKKEHKKAKKDEETKDADMILLTEPTNIPQFLIKMEPCTIGNEGYVIVPATFAKRYLNGTTVTGVLFADGLNYLVEFRNENDQWFIATGWTDFAIRNKLKLMDTCVFELVEAETLKLKVSIAHQ